VSRLQRSVLGFVSSVEDEKCGADNDCQGSSDF